MASYYSTQTRITNKIKMSRVVLWADKNRDGVIDPDTMTQALSYARQVIDGYIVRRFGASQVSAWTDVTVPPILAQLADDLAIYWLASSATVLTVNPPIEQAYERAISWLERIADSAFDLVDATGGLIADACTAGNILIDTSSLPRVFPRSLLSTPPSDMYPCCAENIYDEEYMK